MSVQSVEGATTHSNPVSQMSESSSVTKVSKFAADDKFYASPLPLRPFRHSGSYQHLLPTIEEVEEPLSAQEEVRRPATPNNLNTPVQKASNQSTNLRRIALLNTAKSSIGSK